MARAQRNNSAQQTAERGIVSRGIQKLAQVLVFFLLTLLFSILIEWTGMATGYWQEPGTEHSEKMLATELGYLNQDFQRSALVQQPVAFARRFADTFYEITIKRSGLQAAIIWLATPTQTSNHYFRQQLHALYLQVENYILAALIVTQIFAVRLAILTLAMPAFIMLGLLALVDGLVQRDIRRWSGGRETSFVYHWAKNLVYPALILPWIIYLAMPDSVHPNYVVLPFAILFALSIRIMASTFKKYL